MSGCEYRGNTEPEVVANPPMGVWEVAYGPSLQVHIPKDVMSQSYVS